MGSGPARRCGSLPDWRSPWLTPRRGDKAQQRPRQDAEQEGEHEAQPAGEGWGVGIEALVSSGCARRAGSQAAGRASGCEEWKGTKAVPRWGGGRRAAGQAAFRREQPQPYRGSTHWLSVTPAAATAASSQGCGGRRRLSAILPTFRDCTTMKIQRVLPGTRPPQAARSNDLITALALRKSVFQNGTKVEERGV